MCYIVFISRIQRPLRPASVFSMMMMMMMCHDTSDMPKCPGSGVCTPFKQQHHVTPIQSITTLVLPDYA